MSAYPGADPADTTNTADPAARAARVSMLHAMRGSMRRSMRRVRGPTRTTAHLRASTHRRRPRGREPTVARASLVATPLPHAQLHQVPLHGQRALAPRGEDFEVLLLCLLAGLARHDRLLRVCVCGFLEAMGRLGFERTPHNFLLPHTNQTQNQTLNLSHLQTNKRHPKKSANKKTKNKKKKKRKKQKQTKKHKCWAPCTAPARWSRGPAWT